jgi:hypothetical protein
VAKSTHNIPPDKVQRYRNLIAKLIDVEVKGKKTPYTSINGYMFTFLTPEGDLAMRLSAKDIQIWLTKGVAQMHQHGRLMKDFIAVPEAWWLDEAMLLEMSDLLHQMLQSH